MMNEYERAMTDLLERLVKQLEEIDQSIMTIVERMDLKEEKKDTAERD